ncbi:MAG: SOS response-associated peptidase [Candidatus Thorarchaeota archaeon SMTZ1-83]
MTIFSSLKSTTKTQTFYLRRVVATRLAVCGRFNFLSHKKAVEERFGVKKFDFEIVPRYNIAPTQQIAAILADPEVQLVGMHWGFIPFWAKDKNIGNRMINARSETVAESKAFKHSFMKKRCLIPATGFYEWRKIGKVKKPMHIRLESRQPFAFAGIYNHWKSPSGNTLMSCAILTTSPNELLEPIHNRMPVVLQRKDESMWLDPENEDVENLKRLLNPYASEHMEAYEISTYVNSTSNTGPMCTVPVESASL